MDTARVRVSDQGQGWPLAVPSVTGRLDPTPVRVVDVEDQTLVRVQLDQAATGKSGEQYVALLVLHVQGSRTVGPVGWGIPVHFLTEYPAAEGPLPWEPWPACRGQVELLGE